jgi:nucleotide-binding universal stress UspA family protein
MLKRILVGIDDGSGGRDAAVLASALAAHDDADLLLVAVYPDPLLPFPLSLGRDGPGLDRQAEQMLGEVRRACAPSGRTRALPDVSAARALRHLAEREHADLLVLGSSHRVPDGRARGGRTARQVLHDAPCAVAIAARGLANDGAPASLARIVAGYDDAPESRIALALAAELAAGASAQLEAVAVADETLPTLAAPVGAAGVLARWDEVVELKRRHAQRLAHEAQDACAASGGATGTLRVGEPAAELAEVAADADLLVLGSRRWGALERIALGSTGEELLHEAPCSLLLVPRPGRAEVAADGAHAATAAAPASAAAATAADAAADTAAPTRDAAV